MKRHVAAFRANRGDRWDVWSTEIHRLEIVLNRKTKEALGEGKVIIATTRARHSSASRLKGLDYLV